MFGVELHIHLQSVGSLYSIFLAWLTQLNRDFPMHHLLSDFSYCSQVNACKHSMQSLLFYLILSKNTNLKLHKTVILPVVLYGCETWSLILRDKRKLRVFVHRLHGEYLD